MLPVEIQVCISVRYISAEHSWCCWLCPCAVSILRAKTRKRLEAVAAVAAAAGTPGSVSVNPSRWPTASGVGTPSCDVTFNGGIAAAAGCAGAGAGDGGSAGAGAGGSSSSPVSELEGLVGAKQRMTSKLMLKLLTQEIEVRPIPQ
jgi:hypothetical protein